MKPKFLLIPWLLILGISLTACKSSGNKPTPTNDLNTIHTQVAGTVIAQRTQAAGQTAIAKLTEIAQATSTATSQVAPTQGPGPTDNTPIPYTAAPTAIPTQASTATPIPTSTATPIPPTAVPPTPIPPTAIPPKAVPTAKTTPCNLAMFVKDVSVSDGTVFIAGNQFTKTWRIQNVGTCKWTREYAMVYQSGELMGAGKVQYLEETVQPGGTVDISIDFTAPSAEGIHTGYWKLRNQNGTYFGMGKGDSEAFWVQIDVANPSDVAYNLSNHICDAEWRTKDGQVACTAGSVERVETPKLETGKTDEEVAIVVHPSDGDGGYITGTYPERRIKDGDWFRTSIGCMYDHPHCNVTFRLDYQVEGGKILSLGKWKQTYDGKTQNVDIDLSFLVGKRVTFILTVQNNGSNDDDWAFWLHPRIVR